MSKEDPRLAPTTAPTTTLAVFDTEVTAVEAGLNFTTWAAAVLGPPARLVVTPASTDTLQTEEHVQQPDVSTTSASLQ